MSSTTCGDVNAEHLCGREKEHPGNHYDPRTKTAWTGAPVPTAAMPIQPGDPSAGISRPACGVAFPDNTGWVICTLPHSHPGYHLADPSIPPVAVQATPSVEPASAAIWVQPPQQPADPTVTVQFATGAQRSSMTAGGSVPADYSQFSHVAARLHAETQAEGNGKYGYGNWQKGIPVSNLLSHALAHIYAMMNGDTSENHLGHAIWNLDKAAHFIETRPDLIDILPMLRAKQAP